jgi:ATP-dependent Clp protease adaptor protein ClpS
MATKESPDSTPNAAAAVRKKKSSKAVPRRRPPQLLPPWKVLLHNDDHNTRDYVVSTICELTPLKQPEAVVRMQEADKTGVALLLTTHKERAELYKEQFTSKGLTVTIEAAG